MKNYLFLIIILLGFYPNNLMSQSKNEAFTKQIQTLDSILLSPDQAKLDLDEMVEIVKNTHPNLSFSANLNLIEQRKDALKKSIKKSLTVREFWQVASQLNPLFNDAHVGVRYPVKEFNSYKSKSGFVFPVPIYIDKNSKIFVKEKLGNSLVLNQHDEIISINNIKTSSIMNNLKNRMRGETESLRDFIISRNFPAYFWTLYGEQKKYSLEIISPSGEKRKVTLTEPLSVVKSELASPFNYEILSDDIGYLQIKSFNKSLKEAFSKFLATSFNELSKTKTKKLLLDIRNNSGGAHDVSDLLVPYLTDKTISATSALTARIIKQNQQFSPKSQIGDTITIPFEEPVKNESDIQKFEGEVFLLINTNTYSQAIVFSTMLSDHGLATVVGEKTSGSANQTGQVIMNPLKHSGLLVAAPIYIIYRPNGNRQSGSLLPHIELVDNIENPESMIDELLKRIN